MSRICAKDVNVALESIKLGSDIVLDSEVDEGYGYLSVSSLLLCTASRMLSTLSAMGNFSGTLVAVHTCCRDFPEKGNIGENSLFGVWSTPFAVHDKN